MIHRHREHHKLENVGWLRAAVLGANDGIVSIACLVLGVAASHASHHEILVAGVASLVAGAMSMATGEYVSVQSQADTELAALNTERAELAENPEGEWHELTNLYVARGVDKVLAREVACQLMTHDALSAHAREELGITQTLSARPLPAAFASACSFSAGALIPLLIVLLSPLNRLILLVVLASLLSLAFLGGLAARMGGANVLKGAFRVVFWSALAMGVTTGVGTLFGTAV